ncbi:TPA: hypothetical protein IAC10_11265 [Candidatus Scatousia excrementigallinarum]|uniref:HEAT repeat domain-containing protein n=1 Tax=Candidatus Scatousia excrementigallinarum TaxID=2840935 RepID=A0A9D1JNL7_9BACT|nr:hypothetical protein [Candidatus Scatousia excrementigallinarum]
MNELIKKLSGKNKNDYEQVAKDMIDNADVALFKELVANDDFLFDFVKQNVAERLANACNETNYRNLLKFFVCYSPYYDDFIISTLARYADEDLTDEILDIFENGTNDEKTYCAKYFFYIQDSLATELLRANSYTDDESLNANCAATLGVFQDNVSYNQALEKLKSDDEFEQLSGVKFLVLYGNKDAVPALIETMKTSTMAENIAGEIPYLSNLFELLDKSKEDALLVINHIINGLGEILGLPAVFDYELYDVFERLIRQADDSKTAVVLLNAADKFETLTENDEYLFDEDKNTKNEVQDIKKLLGSINKKQLKPLVLGELNEDSPFVYTALDFADDVFAIRELLKCNNQTIILKTAEVLKRLGNLDEPTKTVALLKVTDDNIKSIIRAL